MQRIKKAATAAAITRMNKRTKNKNREPNKQIVVHDILFLVWIRYVGSLCWLLCTHTCISRIYLSVFRLLCRTF